MRLPKSKWPLLACIFVSGISPLGHSSAAERLSEAGHVALAGNVRQTAITVLAARRYATFWDTGDESHLRAALSGDFMDRTLPPGRVQGIEGPLQASKMFRAAVPDLRAEIVHMVPAGDRIAVHYRFTGHFSGRFGEVAGQGQAIDFQAHDVYRIKHGKIVENWHLEDNLTLLRQMGIVK